jgi:flagellar hook-length control protein FliK
MSALPIVANAIPAVTPSQPSSASADSAPDSISFGAVLEAQLSTTSGTEKAVLILPEGNGAVPQIAAGKSDVAAEPTAADIAAELPFLPVNLLAVQPVPVKPVDVAAPAPSLESIAAVLPHAMTKAPDTDPRGSLLSNVELSQTESLETAATAATPANIAASARQTLPFGEEPVHREEDRSTEGQPTDPSVDASAAALPRDARLDTRHSVQQLTASIPGIVGEGRWAESFSQRVSWMVGQQVQAAQFRVEPPQLGPIEIRLSISNDQANLMFSAPHAVARDAIQTSLPRLQEMLAQSGIALGDVSVGAHSAQDRGSFDRREGSSSDRISGVGAAMNGVVTESQVPLRRGWGLVDLFA